MPFKPHRQRQSRTREGGDSGEDVCHCQTGCYVSSNTVLLGHHNHLQGVQTRVQSEKNIQFVSSGWVEENASFSGVRSQSKRTGSTRQNRRQEIKNTKLRRICKHAAHPTLTHYAFAPICVSMEAVNCASQ